MLHLLTQNLCSVLKVVAPVQQLFVFLLVAVVARYQGADSVLLLVRALVPPPVLRVPCRYDRRSCWPGTGRPLRLVLLPIVVDYSRA